MIKVTLTLIDVTVSTYHPYISPNMAPPISHLDQYFFKHKLRIYNLSYRALIFYHS